MCSNREDERYSPYSNVSNMKKKEEAYLSHIKRKQRVLAAAAALAGVLTLLLGGCGSTENGSDDSTSKDDNTAAADSEYLLTVDGYGVTEEEFMLFLRDQKAATANYYWVNYEMQPDNEFWNTEVDGQTPTEYAKERALDAVVEAKEEFILADERGILEYKDYDGMMEDMEAENEKRAQQQEDGEAFYGLTEYTPFTYYQYLSGNVRSELEKDQEEQSDPTEEQLQAVYEENKENLTLGTVYEYTVRYEDGTEESVSQNTRDIGKEDTTTEDLIYNYFAYMNPGETIQGYSYRGETADITLQSVEDQGYMSFEEAEDSLRTFFARNEISELIADRVENAEIVFDQERYDALEMP